MIRLKTKYGGEKYASKCRHTFNGSNKRMEFDGDWKIHEDDMVCALEKTPVEPEFRLVVKLNDTIVVYRLKALARHLCSSTLTDPVLKVDYTDAQLEYLSNRFNEVYGETFQDFERGVVKVAEDQAIKDAMDEELETFARMSSIPLEVLRTLCNTCLHKLLLNVDFRSRSYGSSSLGSRQYLRPAEYSSRDMWGRQPDGPTAASASAAAARQVAVEETTDLMLRFGRTVILSPQNDSWENEDVSDDEEDVLD